MTSHRPLIAVFGSSTMKETDAAWRLAYELGGELARAGAGVMTGGYGGTMAACSRGAREAGGHVVGVTVAGGVTRYAFSLYEDRCARR